MKKEEVQTYVLIAICIILLYVSYLIIKPFVTAILASFILAFTFHPIYKWLNKFIKNETISGILVTLLVLTIIILPFIAISGIALSELIILYKNGTITRIGEFIAQYTNTPQIADYISSSSLGIINAVGSTIASFLLNIVTAIIAFLVMIITTFYLLIKGEEFVLTIKKIVPFRKKDEIINHLGKTTKAIINGFFVIAFFQFLVAAIGFTLIGVKSPFIWAILVGFSALLPYIGPFIIVTVPLIVINLIGHNYWIAIGVGAIYLVLGYLENFVRPKIIAKTMKINMVIVLLGIIGGLELMGFVGMFIGPIILSAMIVIIEDYYYNYIK